jgi:anti-sigma factor RsiW
MMACNEEWLEILSSWQDGEATAEELSRAEVHVTSCSSCATTRGEFQRLHAAMRPVASSPLAAGPPRRQPRVSHDHRRPIERRHLIVGTLAAAAGVLAVWGLRRRSAATQLVDELETRHRAAFARATPCEFESSDPAAVRAWVEAHIGYDVEVPAIPGATLLGARRCQLEGLTTASVLYRREGEALSVFLPRAGTSVETATLRLAASGCTVGRLGAAVCARPGRFVVAESPAAARSGLEDL